MSEEKESYQVDKESLERDTEISFFTAGGPGGQHRNRSATGVRLFHRPSGIVITATERRSQAQNRAAAFERLVERLHALSYRAPPRRPTRPTTASVARRREGKQRISAIKRTRRDRGEE